MYDLRPFTAQPRFVSELCGAQFVGYDTAQGWERKDARLVYVTDGLLRNRLVSMSCGSLKVVSLDEVDERSGCETEMDTES